MTNSVALKKDGLYLNEEKFFLLSGDFHYFRTVPEGWERRLKLMKDFGLTAVTTYVAWNLHEPKRGEFCFEGICDLPLFLTLAQKVGLKVVLRCSPYMCGEWEFGGLPSWLLKDRTMALRSSDEGFMEPLNEYNKVLCSVIRPFLYTNGGPIILIGVENEYGSFGDDQDYLRMLSDFYRKENIDVPRISANGSPGFKYINGTLPENWNGIDFQALPESLGQLELLEKYQPDRQLMVGEAWVGNIMFWGVKYERNTNIEKYAAFLKEALARNVYVNFYMFCGGTNFGFMSGSLKRKTYMPLPTSYDYDAPISEEGMPTPKYFAMRDVLDEYLGKEKRPHVMPDYSVQSIERIDLDESAQLFENLDILVTGTKKANKVICMEDMDQDYGFIRYTTPLRYTGNYRYHLKIDGLADRALIYLDGKYLGAYMRDQKDQNIVFEVAAGGSELSILVENMGRIDYGYDLYDYKGINGCVRFEMECSDGSYLYNYANCMRYTIESIPLKSLNGLRYKEETKLHDTPCFYRGTFTAKPGADTFLDMQGWEKGMVWINGFNLGRYWKIEPQRTLYVPGTILKKENTIEIFELHEADPTFSVSAKRESMLCENAHAKEDSTKFQLL